MDFSRRHRQGYFGPYNGDHVIDNVRRGSILMLRTRQPGQDARMPTPEPTSEMT